MHTDPRALARRLLLGAVAWLFLSLCVVGVSAQSPMVDDAPDLGPLDPDFAIAISGNRVIVGAGSVEVTLKVWPRFGAQGNRQLVLTPRDGIVLAGGQTTIALPELAMNEVFTHNVLLKADGAPSTSFVGGLDAMVMNDLGGYGFAIGYAPSTTLRSAVQGTRGAVFANTPSRGDIVIYPATVAPGTLITVTERYDFLAESAVELDKPADALLAASLPERTLTIAGDGVFTPTAFVFLPQAVRGEHIAGLPVAGITAFQIVDLHAVRPTQARRLARSTTSIVSTSILASLCAPATTCII